MCLQLKHTNAKQGPASPDRTALTTPWVSAAPGGQDSRRCSQDRSLTAHCPLLLKKKLQTVS